MTESRVRRLVVKVGTNTLAGPGGKPDPDILAALATDLDSLVRAGTQVVLVSSGAIGAGRAVLGGYEHPADVVQRQALAALGQHHLMQAWDHAFAERGRRVAQVLLTYHTFSRRRSYLNLRNCLERLLELGVVPVLNENDTVSIEEIDASFGDNDRLGALVASKLEADLYLILSDVAGLHDRPPSEPGAKRIAEVPRITDEIMALAGARTGSRVGRGGMGSKLANARLATEVGIPVVIAHGREPGVASRAVAGDDVGTRFLASDRRSGPQRWLLIAPAEGQIAVDEGAAQALASGRHLLPAGVTGVDGTFDVQSVVELVHGGRVVGRALAELSSEDLVRCQGLDSTEARRVLGVAGSVNVTRKGRLVLLHEAGVPR